MKDLIRQKLIEYYATCDVDKWGQMGIISVWDVFKQDKEAVIEYANNNKGILDVRTYGGRFGTWIGISKIEDQAIKQECDRVFNNNPNYKLSMTRWKS